MRDAAWLAVPLGVLIGAVLLNGGKKTSWFPIHALVKVSKTRKGTTYSVTRPAKRKTARKRKR
jgi:hypothetical protein